MPTKIALLLWALLAPLWASADEVVLHPEHPQTYTVRKGDTLWDIAGRFLTKPWQWPELWEANPQIANPHLIYPGDVLALTYRDGRPILGLVKRNREVRLSPRIREIAHEEAIHAIPLGVIQPFLTRPLVAEAGELERAPYIVGSPDERIASGAGQRVYVRALDADPVRTYSLYRPGPAYRDPVTGAILGYEAEHVGEGVLEALGDPATLRVTRSHKEILKGDRLLPREESEFADFVPHAPAGTVDGEIIRVLDGVSNISNYKVVVLNRGTQDGMEPGHVLAIFRRGPVIKDQTGTDVADRTRREERERVAREDPSAMTRMLQTAINDVQRADRALRDIVGTPMGEGAPVKVALPDERAGELMIFRAFERVSFGLVMNLQQAVHVADRVGNP